MEGLFRTPDGWVDLEGFLAAGSDLRQAAPEPSQAISRVREPFDSIPEHKATDIVQKAWGKPRIRLVVPRPLVSWGDTMGMGSGSDEPPLGPTKPLPRSQGEKNNGAFAD